MTIQSVWEPGAVILDDHELALLMNKVAAAKVAFAETYAEIQTAKEWLAEAVENSRERDGPLRQSGLKVATSRSGATSRSRASRAEEMLPLEELVHDAGKASSSAGTINHRKKGPQ